MVLSLAACGSNNAPANNNAPAANDTADVATVEPADDAEPAVVSEYKFDQLCSQAINGDYSLLTAIAGPIESLRNAACAFAGNQMQKYSRNTAASRSTLGFSSLALPAAILQMTKDRKPAAMPVVME